MVIPWPFLCGQNDVFALQGHFFQVHFAALSFFQKLRPSASAPSKAVQTTVCGLGERLRKKTLKGAIFKSERAQENAQPRVRMSTRNRTTVGQN